MEIRGQNEIEVVSGENEHNPSNCYFQGSISINFPLGLIREPKQVGIVFYQCLWGFFKNIFISC